ncbi:MAG: L-threonylcarbamoyladenylate synthase [Edaphobacter sp.]|uniref:L-threonylcarbamoyladenylate synthase n=1 Tax=Edaphobacter sp. TaxID=1934404 RepID=UPI00238B9D13|nr:L-threonylcarbamoyladenylate synthase [Edaphobacter sp.]MDE1176326.1 L-threonylcarbamoyladenylate synthase [Edaphobacter sp.]
MSGGKTERLSGTEGVARAAEILRSGGTVAFPTETVYGLGANALDSEAVAKIFAAKERPGWDPVIAHVADREMVSRVAEVPAAAELLMERFWPGPLTLLLPRTVEVPDSVTAGRPLVGVRMPRHEMALALIREAGVPLAAPSANRFGRTSPTTAEHVLEDLDGRIDAILDGGPTSVGVESTVIGPSEDGEGWVMYRPGGVSLEELQAVVGVGNVDVFRPAEFVRPPESLPSPGVGIRHYAPRARLVLVFEPSRKKVAARLSLVETIGALTEQTDEIGVMLPEGWEASRAALVYRWGAWGDAEALARRLFAGLRELDERGAKVIICPVPEMDGIGEAMRDRLRKAAREK